MIEAAERRSPVAPQVGRSLEDLDVAACIWCSVDEDRDRARHLLAGFIARYSGSLSIDALLEAGLNPDAFARVQALMTAGETAAAVAAVTPAMLELGIVGGPHEVIEQCERLLDAGVRHISFGPPLGPDPDRALELFGKQVLPALRAFTR